MTKRMLIDATHSEETRVVVADNNQLLDYEYESAMRKQLRGNIFLAKVTRVEPSLQAAFVNYGGNRHGFLPFSEIHPDYYRIPIADREALIEEQRQALEEVRRAEEEEDAELEEMERGGKKKGKKSDKEEQSDNIESLDDDTKDEEPQELGGGAEFNEDDEENSEEDDDDEASDEADESDSDEESGEEENNNDKKGRRRYSRGRGRGKRGKGRGGRRANHRNERVEMVGGDSIDGDRPIRPNLTRRYKIQEVIKRGQIMLVQVSKEERGAKGAAVTTYLSLPGRYCVLMPNSPRSGGVSRKIANYKDRKRLREILKEFNVPEGMSVIVRTAGVARTKTEIKRDLDYLLRLWDNIRNTTLESQAPALIYEESELVKRAVRDIYDRDMQEVIVEGERGYKIAKDIMKMMIPSHAKRVKEYKDHKRSLFQYYSLEQQISGIGEPSVPLKSGGSLVIHPTEALVSIDVNSGRATKERHIEETALRTNLEAAEEVARQLRLRDLGGLVVIDFIDMEDRRNNGKVERKLKEALSTDRARLQVGRISSFGLLELSRQRISASVTETQFQKCDHCEGTGFIRTVDSMAIVVLRALETLAIEGKAAEVAATVTNEVALYILNQKRHTLTDIESRYGMKIFIHADEKATPTFHDIEVLKTRKELEQENQEENVELDTEEEEEDSDDNNKSNNQKGRSYKNNRNQNNKGRGRGRKNNKDRSQEEENDQAENDKSADKSEEPKFSDADVAENKPKRGRRKSKSSQKDEVKKTSEKPQKAEDAVQEEKPKRGRKPKSSKTEDAGGSADTSEEKEDKPKKRSAAKKKTEEAKIDQSEPSNDDSPAEEKQSHAREAEVVNEAPVKKKKGWWSKVTE